MTPYRHTQVGYLMIVSLGLGLAVGAWALLMAEVPPLALAALGLLLVALVLFATLTTAVEDGAFLCYFGPGLIRRRVPLARIAAVEVTRNRWYWGWGIRLTPRGWLWNVSGLDAVELHLRDGRRFRVGTDEPEKLAAALRERGVAAPPGDRREAGPRDRRPS